MIESCGVEGAVRQTASRCLPGDGRGPAAGRDHPSVSGGRHGYGIVFMSATPVPPLGLA